MERSTSPDSMIAWVIIVEQLGDWQPCPIPQQKDLLEEAETDNLGDGLRAPAYAQFPVDTADLGLDRIRRDHQRFGHLAIGLPGNQQAYHLCFLSRKRFGKDR